MTTHNNITLKEQVRERYGAIAEQYLKPAVTAPIQLLDTRPQADAGCCGPAGGCCSPGDVAQDASLGQALYQEAELTGLPDSVTLASLGCGNPTAIASLKPGEWPPLACGRRVAQTKPDWLHRWSARPEVGRSLTNIRPVCAGFPPAWTYLLSA
jgi:hypothetical protein